MVTLSDTAVDYLESFTNSGKIINEIFEKYHDEQRFLEWIELFNIDSQTDRDRSIAVTRIINNIVHFVKENIKRAQKANESNMNKIQHFLTESVNQMTEEDKKAIDTITHSWNAIVNEFGI